MSSRASVAHLVPELAQLKAKAGSANNNSNEGGASSGQAQSDHKNREAPLSKAIQDSTKVAGECQHGLLSQIIKDAVFNCDRASLMPPPQA